MVPIDRKEIAGRSYTDADGYRYGYQGKYAEKDPETGWNAFELRMYDSRIGRWLSIDPAGEFLSPYVGMGNDPGNLTDPTGGFTDDPDPKPVWTQGSNLEGITVRAYIPRNNPQHSMYNYFRMQPYQAKFEQQAIHKGLDVTQAAWKAKGWDQYYLTKFSTSAKATLEWREMNYWVLDGATMLAPLPKVGLVRLGVPKLFGTTTGRVFWSGGGITGKAFAEATEHAFVYGGTTLEGTIAGKTITYIQSVTGRNAATGKMWKWASSNFAKGAKGEVHAFLGEVRTNAFWYTERNILENSKTVTNIITHSVK